MPTKTKTPKAKISMDKIYTTRDGRPAKVFSVNGNAPYNVIGMITDDGHDESANWTETGGFLNDLIPKESSYDLIEVKTRIKGWIPVYDVIKGQPRIGAFHREGKPTAAKAYDYDYKGLMDVEYVEGEGFAAEVAEVEK